jgi:hypothetical protein
MDDPASSIADSHFSAESPDAPPRPTVTFLGNTYDLMAVVGATIAGMTLFTCATCNFGFYCLPIIPILLGIVGLFTTREAVDPDRTRLLSWVSIGVGAAILLLIVVFVALYFGFIFFVIAADNGRGF